MLRIYLALAFILLLNTAYAERLLIVGDSLHPPFSYLNGQSAKGIYSDIVSGALEKMGEDGFAIKLVPWKRALYMVETGGAVGIFPPHYFPDQRPFLRSYSVPIMAETSTVYCNVRQLDKLGFHSRPEPTWPDDFVDLRFALSLGVLMGGDEFWGLVNLGKLDVIRVPGPDNAMQLLNLGRADCHINDRVTIQWYLKALQHQYPSFQPDYIKEIVRIEEEAGFLALSSHWPMQQADPFLRQFNETIEQMRKAGEIQDIILRNISEAKLLAR